MHLKSLQSVLVVCGGEDNTGQFERRRAAQSGDDIEAVHARHANIEQQHIGLGKLNQVDGFQGVGSFAHHLNVWFLSQEL